MKGELTLTVTDGKEKYELEIDVSGHTVTVKNMERNGNIIGWGDLPKHGGKVREVIDERFPHVERINTYWVDYSAEEVLK